MTELSLSDEEDILKYRAERDTGVFARDIMGYCYDEIREPGSKRVEKVRVGEGGVRPDGWHQIMVAAIDGESEQVMTLLPRGCLKSTISQCHIQRNIVSQVDVRIAYAMHKLDKVRDKSLAIRGVFEDASHPVAPRSAAGQKIRRYWGKFRGEFWNQLAWTSSRRQSVGIQEPTFTAFSPDSPLTGGHYHVIWLDDILDAEWVRTELGRERTRQVWLGVHPLLLPGAKELINGTRWHHADLYGEIEREHPEYVQIIADAGVDVIREPETKRLTIQGEPQFGTLTKRQLQAMLDKDYDFFMAQYMNRVSVGANAPFLREHFRVISSHQLDLPSLSGFLLCDSATSEDNPQACYSVIAYVALDEMNNAYLLDMAVGHWGTQEFVKNWCRMLGKWHRQCNHRGERLEKTTANDVFRRWIEAEAPRVAGCRANIVEIPRKGSEKHKDNRILRLSTRLANGQLYVVRDTFPRVFTDLGKSKVLFDERGYMTEEGSLLASGELIDEFVHFPRWPKKDIPDCLADLDAIDPHNEPYCSWVPTSLARQSDRRDHSRPGGDWFQDRAKELGV